MGLLPSTDNNNDKTSVLKSTRLAKGLTLEIVHEATKIPMDALKAIEEGYSVRLLTPFYYRGFIKIYALFLGLDVGEIYRQYGLDQPAKPTSSATVSVKSNRRIAEQGPHTGHSQQLGIGDIVFLEQSQDWFAFIFKPKTLKLILKVIGVLILFFCLFKIGGCVASHMNKKVTSNKKQAVKSVIPYSVTKHEAVQAQSQDNKVEVAVRAVKDTFLRVKTDGHVVFETTLSKGSMESWGADNRIELSGRDIEQLDMEVNGKHIGSLGGGERRIRRVLITPEGLTVKK